LNKKILNLAIPNIISNLTVPLLGAVDTAIVGHLEHVYYLGAIAVGSTIFNFIFWGFGFLRMGTTGLTAQAYGSENPIAFSSILIRVEVIALFLSGLILLIQNPLLEISFWFIETSPEVEEFTRLYFNIRIFSAPATLALYGLNGWFLGMQNSRYPMYITIILNSLNIVLNLVFVYGYGMNVDGVAWGSLLASYIALFFGIILFGKTYLPTMNLPGVKEVLKLDELAELLKVNRDIFIRTLCLIFVFTFFTAKSAEAGDLILAANTILLQFWMIASYGIDGFAYAAESLVGRFKGAGDREMLKQAVKNTLFWGLGLGLTGSAVYFFFDESLLELFTDKRHVIELAHSVMIWTILAPAVSSFCYVWDGIYIGATATAAMRNTMLIATLLCYLPAYYVGLPYLGIHALWLAMILFMMSRGLTLWLFAPSQIFGTITRTTTK